jgi:hypothetical protein
MVPWSRGMTRSRRGLTIRKASGPHLRGAAADQTGKWPGAIQPDVGGHVPPAPARPLGREGLDRRLERSPLPIKVAAYNTPIKFIGVHRASGGGCD